MSSESPGAPCNSTPPDQAEAPPADEQVAESPFPIVGIGASAGGLEAFTQFLAHLPARTGMAFVLVQHLDPRHESRLTDLPGSMGSGLTIQHYSLTYGHG
jgi:two-component system CheB/CheR fusion protein